MTQVDSSAKESNEGSAGSQRPVIRGRKTWSMISELRLVVPSSMFGPFYRVTGDWETLVESRQTLEWIKVPCVAILGAFIIGPMDGSSDLVDALNIYAFMMLMYLTLAALEAFWVARHAGELELVDRAESGYDEWCADRRRQRSWPLVLFGALLSLGIGGWMLWSMLQPDSWMNPWFFAPAALLLVWTSIRGVLGKLRNA